MYAENSFQDKLKKSFMIWSGVEAETFDLIPASGSNRRYCRIKAGNLCAMGVYNPDLKENVAFIKFTQHFLAKGLPVPEILAEDLDNHVYLIEDLGDETLYSFLTSKKQSKTYQEGIIDIYKQVIEFLPEFQIRASQGFDYNHCYPRSSFDSQSMMWDLNYFKYYFLKLANILFDEQELEADFIKLTAYLSQVPSDFFLYRDFQSRNIMIRDGKPWFIDYQGGRKGPLQYDIASLLWDAKADLPQQLRNILLEYYIGQVRKYIDVDDEQFMQYYYSFVYIRIMQALGAYGFRGFYERKEHFLLSIPFAVKNLEWLLQNAPLQLELPELNKCMEMIVKSDSLRAAAISGDKLTLSIYSFSYKNGLPHDLSGYGGGFVFDCRALPNPGRFKEYKELSGLDQSVSDFLNAENAVHEFYNHTEKLVDQAVENYITRGFERLMVSYGCTGGQHRSVWCAERLQKNIAERFDIVVNLVHREL